MNLGLLLQSITSQALPIKKFRALECTLHFTENVMHAYSFISAYRVLWKFEINMPFSVINGNLPQMQNKYAPGPGKALCVCQNYRCCRGDPAAASVGFAAACVSVKYRRRMHHEAIASWHT